MAGLLARVPSTLEEEAGGALWLHSSCLIVLGLMGTFPPLIGWVSVWFGREQ